MTNEPKLLLELTYPLPAGTESRNDWKTIWCRNVYSNRTVVLTRIQWTSVDRFGVRWMFDKIDSVYNTKEEAFIELYKRVTTP
jgi:hypothetical protein